MNGKDKAAGAGSGLSKGSDINTGKIFYGWWVVGACALIALTAAVTRYAFSIFMPYMLKDLGWTRAAIGAALTPSHDGLCRGVPYLSAG